MKKVMLVALVAVLAMSMVFAGGKKDAGNAGKVTLNVMGYGDNANSEGQEFARMVAEFMEENPDVEVKYELLFDEAYHQKVSARLAAGDVPDVAYMGADARWGASWQEAGVQIDNVPYMPSNIVQDRIPDFFGTGVKPYIPLGGSNYCTVVAVNMDLLNELNGGKLPQTYEDLKALAALCNAKGIACLSTHGVDSWVWGSCVMSGIIPRYTNDPQWIEKACEGKVKFTDANFVEALNSLAVLVKDGVLDPNSALLDSGAGFSAYQNGKILMYIDGQWAMGTSNLGDANTKLIPIPTLPGEKYYSGVIAAAWQVGYGITKAATADAAKLDAAKRFLAFINSDDEITNRIVKGSISSPLADVELPEGVDKLVAEKGKLGVYPWCYVIDSYLTGTANDLLNAGMQDIVRGNQTAAQVAAAVQAAFDAQ
ncbi:MAG: extracellular solute-binding protein [Treponemataceae bacterium]|nr:extracellular solute-binding protein [Treponemataceae bacterium]